MPAPDPQKPTRTAPPAPADGTVPPPETLAPDPALYPFLAPAQAGGELGRLGRYRVLGVVGQGGMGVVFRAEDTALRRQVALKVMLPQFAANPLAKARFLREGRAAAAVEHDHILQVFNVDEDRGVPFLAMPLLRGMTLADALKTGHRPPPTEVLRVGREIADGLAAAHAAGLVHRDIKTANVWLEGAKRRVKILDFGLARHAADDPADGGPHTSSGAAVGTPAFMSPEQANGETVDARTDLWSLGVILYEMTTGRRPFTGPNTLAVIAALATHDPPPPAAVAPDCPPDLNRLVAALLTKDPARRPADAAAVAAELGRIEQEMSVSMAAPVPLPDAPRDDPWADLTAAGVSVTTAPATAPAPVRGKPPAGAVWAAAGVLVVLAGVFAAWWLAAANRPGPPPTDRDEVVVAPTPRPTPTKKTPPKSDAPITTEREAAERLVRVPGVYVSGRTVDGTSFDAATDKPLPGGSFTVIRIAIPQELPTGFAPDTLLPAVAALTALEWIDGSWNTGLRTDDELERLAQTPSREALHRLGTGIPLTARTSVTLTRFPRLRSFAAVGGQEDAFRALGALPALSYLSLQGLGESGRQVTDADYEALAALPLTHLTLKGKTGITPEGAAKLAAMPRLESLNTFGTDFDAAVVGELAKSRSLRYLGLLYAKAVHGHGLDALAGSPHLRHLNLSWSAAGDDDLRPLEAANSLRRLDLFGTRVTAAGRAKLAAALPLCTIYYTDENGKEAAIRPQTTGAVRPAVAALLKAGVGVKVKVGAAHLEWKSADEVTEADRPYGLAITSAPEMRAALAAVPPETWSPTSHHHLFLKGAFTAAEAREAAAAATPAGVNAIDTLSAELTDDAYAELLKIPGLEVASCRGVSAATFGRAVALPDLRHLGVVGVGFAAESWAKVRGVPLYSISLEGNPEVDDAVLDHLATLPRAGVVNLRGTKVTKAGAERLAAALPTGCKVYWDGGEEVAAPVAGRVKAVAAKLLALKATVGVGPRGVNVVGRTITAPDDITADDLFTGVVLRPAAGGRVLSAPALDALRHLPTPALHPSFTLSVTGGPVSAEELGALSAVGTLRGLRGLTLIGSGLTDDAVARLAGFPDLRYVLLNNQAPLTDAGLKAVVAAVPNLRRLDFDGTKVTSAGLSALRGTGVSVLSLQGNAGVDDAAVEHLAAIPKLEEVRLQRSAVTAAGVAMLKAARPGLRVEWGGDRAADAGADAAAHRKAAEWVLGRGGRCSVQVTGAGKIELAADLPAGPFKVYQVAFRGLTDPAALSLDALFPLATLDMVGLADMPLTDDDLRRLLPALARLNVRTVSLENLPPLTDNGLRALRELKTLELAYVQGNRLVTPAGLLDLAGHPRLTSLFTVQSVDDEFVRAVCRKSQWRGLGFGSPRVTAAVLPDLLANPDLHNLKLNGVRLSDADLLRLTALKHLAALEVKTSGASEEAFRKVAAALPKCKVVWDEGTIEPRER